MENPNIIHDFKGVWACVPSAGDYIHIEKACVDNKTIEKFSNLDVSECKDRCESNSDCVAFEYGVNHGGAGTVYQPGDCLTQSSKVYIECEFLNLDLYIKPDIL